jgi:hypothetical protein
VHVPIDRLEADRYYGSARSSLHHALAAMTFEQIHFGLNPGIISTSGRPESTGPFSLHFDPVYNDDYRGGYF